MEKVTRRKFIKAGSTAIFMAVGYQHLIGSDLLVKQTFSRTEDFQLNQFITLGSDGSIVLFNHRPEMGQGTFQSIPMILAEELDVNMDSVTIRASKADANLYGSQMVVGSRSMQSEFEKLRKMGAAAREVLIKAAARISKVSPDECTTSEGFVHVPDGRKFAYRELIEEARNIPLSENPRLKQRKDFRIIGTPIARRDIPVKTNGEAVFGIDIKVSGMLHASVERSPVFLGKVKSFNHEEVMKLPGVRHVFQTSREVFGRTQEGVAVLADSYWQAEQARKSLKVEWDTQGLEAINDSTLLSEAYRESEREGDELFGKGNVAEVFRQSSKILEATYETPYQAHVPMEPMNAVVSVTDDEIIFWGSTQNPNGIRSMLARKYERPEDKVQINYTFMGGGFGRRSLLDVAEEAADLSKKAGTPVKVIWSREDDQTQGPFRACSLNVMKAALTEDGKVSALEHKVVAQEIVNQTGPNMKAGRQLLGGINTDYLIPNLSVKGVLLKRHIPISYWRAVYHSTNPFAHECFIDELAHATKQDPLEFRLLLLDHPRYRRVLESVAEKTNWRSAKPEGVGRGLAVCERSGAYFAQVIEVSKQGRAVLPTKITTVIDLGICINPDTVKAQTEGSIVMGLGAAYTGLTIKNGAVAEKNFDTYPLLKITQCPEIETHILDSDAPPDGAGESGLPTVAPALTNAIFDLTGKRIRKLPFDPETIA